MTDNQPKRRRDKYNPYILSTADKQYFVSFKDGQGVTHRLEIDNAMYLLLDSFEREDLSYFNEWDRHIEQSELSEETLEHRLIKPPCSVEEAVCRDLQRKQLYRAIDCLTEIQRRRLILYYFYSLTYEKIAEIDGCSVHSVYVAIERAKEKIKNFLKQV